MRRLLTVLFLCPLSFLRSDVLFLRNGGKIEGQITRLSATSITIQGAEGLQTVPRSSVQRITYGPVAKPEKPRETKKFQAGGPGVRQAIGHGQGLYLVADDSAQIYTSADLSVWDGPYASGASDPVAFAYGQGKFVVGGDAGGSNAFLAWSTDGGQTWTDSGTAGAGVVNSIVFRP